jgi:hypothetical protein
MRLGDLLVRSKLVSQADVHTGLDRQAALGGRLGENLVAIGAISPEALDAFIHRIPPEPTDFKSTGIEEGELLALMMRLIYSGNLESVRQFGDAIKLPYVLVFDLVKMAVGFCTAWGAETAKA